MMTEEELREKYRDLQKRHHEVRDKLAWQIRENRRLTRQLAKQDMDMRSMQELINEYKRTSEKKILQNKYDISDEDMARALATHVRDCNFSTRVLSVFRAADIEYMGDVVQYKAEDFLKFRNMGSKSVAEIKNVVNSLGLQFEMGIVYDADLETYLLKK